MKSLSNLELSELINMVDNMAIQIVIYDHVSDKMDTKVKKVIEKYQSSLWKEQDRRAKLSESIN